jgi:hypothetical protein
MAVNEALSNLVAVRQTPLTAILAPGSMPLTTLWALIVKQLLFIDTICPISSIIPVNIALTLSWGEFISG